MTSVVDAQFDALQVLIEAFCLKLTDHFCARKLIFHVKDLGPGFHVLPCK